IDSLEMVRQLFEQGVVQSGFWHQFAMTAHAPTGMKPEDFGVKMIGPEFEGFAKNDLWHEDKDGANHVLYSEGLKKSLFNYMHGACFDFSMQEWFDFTVSEPTIHAGFITDALESNPGVEVTDHAKVVWLGKKPLYDTYIKRKKGKETERARLALISKSYANEVTMDVKLGEWWMGVLEEAEVRKNKSLSFAKLKTSYEQQFGLTIDQLFKEQSWHEIKNFGLLII
ncbi:MAG: radical SAM protein, partial [Reichenbachiella sp.]